MEDNTYYLYRAYIKDQLAINSLPKAFLEVNSFTIRRDLLTTANSSFNCVEIPSDVNNGDIFVLYEPDGNIVYYGVITAIQDSQITTSQIQSFYKGTWIYDNYPTDTIEGELSYLLGQYANGYQKGSTYQDVLMYQEKAPLLIKTGSSTSGNLETYEDKKSTDFETFIYNVYSTYGLVFDFYIPFKSWDIGDSTGGSVTIRKPSSSIIKVGNNAECITSMTPTTTIEQTNKVVVYAKDGTYRTTYIATTTNGIVEEPATVVGRFGVINTKVVYSDDELDTIKSANITEDMFNHKVEFEMIIDNKLYDFWSWELGQTLQIYKGTNYFNSIFTGYEISKEVGSKISTVKIIAGKVRNDLVSLIKMGVAS